MTNNCKQLLPARSNSNQELLSEPIVHMQLFMSLLLIRTHLFLRSSRFFSLSLSPLLPHTHQSSIAPRIPQLSIRSLLSLWHVARTDLTNSLLHRRDIVDLVSCLFLAVVVGFDILFAAIELLVLAGAAGEENQTLTIGF